MSLIKRTNTRITLSLPTLGRTSQSNLSIHITTLTINHNYNNSNNNNNNINNNNNNINNNNNNLILFNSKK